MARKKGRVPSPPPRGDSSSNEEEAAPPPNPRPPSTADADSSDGGEEEESSDSETDATAFQVREVARSPAKPSESDADGSSSDSPEPVQKAAAAARKPKAAESAGKKMQAAESIPSSAKAKKPKPDPAPPSGKAPPPSDPNASSASKGNKKRKEKAGPDHQSPSKPAVRRWTTEDEIKILEALISHVNATGFQPGPVDLIAALGDSLERKNCSKTEMYEKVRNLRQRHEKVASTGILPVNEEDLRKFHISEAVWGESVKVEVAAAPVVSQNDVSSKSKKGQAKKEKKGATAKEAATGTVNETLAESEKGQDTKEKVDGGRLSKKADTPLKSKKRGDHKEDSEEDANTGATKEATNTATQNGGSKSGKSDKEEKDGDAESLGPKERTAATTQNDAETHEEKMDIDPDVKNMRRGFDELQNLYPNLTSYVEIIQAQHPCGETLKRAFEFMADEKACALESKIKKQRVVEMKTEIRRADTRKELTNIFIGLMD